ncbi:restriction endonuclease subunit S [Flavobacterium sp. U410]
MINKKLKVGKVPNLRFPEFTEEWETKKLGEIGEIVTGSTPPTNDESYYGGEYLFVSPADIQTNRYVNKSKTTLTLKGFGKGRKIKKGSSLFVCIGSTIGKVAQAWEDCVTNQQINAIVSLEHNADFVFSLLEFSSKKIKLLSAEQAVPIINKTTFSNIQINIPSLSEQAKIASFLSIIDERIQTQNKIIENLKTQMLGLQENIFRQKVKLKDSNGKSFPLWSFKKGGELFESISNKNHYSDLPILAITQDKGAVPRDLIDYQITVTERSIESYKVVEIGDFIISLRSFQGGIEHSDYTGICSPAYIILRNKIEIAQNFYKYYFKTPDYIKLLNRKLEGIRDGKMISYSYFAEIELPFPTIEEQKQIASFLSKVDQKIQIEKATLERLENQKKYLLQQMFV